MRELILGIFLGVWIIIFMDWVGRHKMGEDMVFYIFTGIIVVMLLWRVIILKMIAKVNPELWLKINKLFATPQYDEEMQKRIIEKQTKREGRKGGRHNL